MTFVQWGNIVSVWIGANGQPIVGFLLAAFVGTLVASLLEGILIEFDFGIGKLRGHQIAVATAVVAASVVFIAFSTQR